MKGFSPFSIFNTAKTEKLRTITEPNNRAYQRKSIQKVAKPEPAKYVILFYPNRNFRAFSIRLKLRGPYIKLHLIPNVDKKYSRNELC